MEKRLTLSMQVEQESCKQRALRMGEAMCKLSGAVFCHLFQRTALTSGKSSTIWGLIMMLAVTVLIRK